MFRKQSDPGLTDLSQDLRDEADWRPGALRLFDIPVDVTALAIEPIAGLLAVGTKGGLVYLFGGPSVEVKITLPEAAPVKFLHFSISTFSVVCIDANHQLSIWNLGEEGRPRLMASARFDPLNSITVSPSFCHAFVALDTGEVKTFDILCKRKSPYTIPDLWKLRQDELEKDGKSLMLSSPAAAVETVIHPRNLGLLFVAYAGGVALTELNARASVRTYELILPPGAPGGAGYGAPDILTPRLLNVTCLAVHPSGHFFAVGYEDGSIGFWATEDDSQPLSLRTLEDDGVDLVDTELLEHALHSPPTRHQGSREPIFKLAWSSYSDSMDPRGGQTTLTVLGGLSLTKPPGLSVLLFPVFNPPDAPEDPPVSQDTLHPHFRAQMIKSLSPIQDHYYHTTGIVQDFLLRPKSSPLYGGNFDPIGILLIVEPVDGLRTVTAYNFPPPSFGILQSGIPKSPATDSDTSNLESLSLDDPEEKVIHPNALPTPFAISSGILGGILTTLDKDVYSDFIRRLDAQDQSLYLRAGMAYPDASSLSDLKLAKFQPHRILSTFTRDLFIRFYDISAQLLLPKTPGTPLSDDFPNYLSHLTIQLQDLLRDSAFMDSIAAPLQSLAIQSVHLAPEAMECAVVLNTGDLVVYYSSTNADPLPSATKQVDAAIVKLDHIRLPHSRFQPFFMLSAQRGPIETCAMSEIGFLAVSYQNDSFMVVDMRGPAVIFLGQSGKEKHHSHKSHRLSLGKLGSPTHDNIKAMAWTISPIQGDACLRVRLIISRESGAGEIYTLFQSKGSVPWSVGEEPLHFKSVPSPIQGGLFVIDSHTGKPLTADRSKLPSVYSGLQVPEVSTGQTACLLISVGLKGARIFSNLIGDRVSKVDWNHRDSSTQVAQVVERMGSHALVVQTGASHVALYSLPLLDHVDTAQLPTASPLPLTIDASGDFLAWSQIPTNRTIYSATYGTLFDIRRVCTAPEIDFSVTRPAVPPHPQPISLGPSSYIGSWLSVFNQSMTGAQLDELLGGPDRPIPQKLIPEKREGSTSAQQTGAGGLAGVAAGAADAQSTIYNKLTSAIGERGQMLDDLSERMNSLEEGSRSMAAQAKRLMTQQAAKSWFGF